MKSKHILFAAGFVIQIVVLTLVIHFMQNIQEKTDNLLMLDEEEEEVGGISKKEEEARIPFNHFLQGEGKVECSEIHRISAKREGVVDHIYVSLGGYVSQDAPLFQIDDSELKYHLRQKVREYETALVELKRAQIGPNEFTLKAKAKEVEEMRILEEKEEKVCALIRDLVQANAASNREKDEHDALLKLMHLRYEKALAEYDSLKAGSTPEDIEIKKAEINEKEASVRLIEKKMQDCKVLSPVSGRVLKIDFTEGEYVNPTSTGSVWIGSEHPLYLHVFIDEKEAWRILPKNDLRAIAIHHSNPNIQFLLQFVRVSPELRADKKLELIFQFEKGKAPIYLGESLDVYIEASSAEDTSYIDYQYSQMQK